MGMISFTKEAGEKLLGIGKAEAAAPASVAATPAPPDAENVAQLSQSAAKAIANYIESLKLHAEALDLALDGSSGSMTAVNDMTTGSTPEPESRWYAVVRRDKQSKINKASYGTPNKCPRTFSADKPMLTHPDKIYPGQVLRIPAA